MVKLIISSLVFFSTCSVNALSLRSLIDASVVNFYNMKGVSVIILFQKDCIACKKQVRDLSCLDKKTNIFLVGTFSQDSDLRTEYKSFNSNYPGLYGDSDFLSKFSITKKITPQILVLNNNLKSKHIMGRRPCSEIASEVKKVSQR